MSLICKGQNKIVCISKVICKAGFIAYYQRAHSVECIMLYTCRNVWGAHCHI